MSFFADNKSRPRLAGDGATGQEPPSKRLRSFLGGDPGTPLGFTGADTVSIAAYGRAFPETSLLGADARAWPLRAGLDDQMLAASGLSASFGPLGSVGTHGALGSLGSLGSLGMSSTAAAFIERNLPKLDASQVMPLKDLSILQGNPLASVGVIQPPVPNARSKTKLCKHFIENNCKFKELCNFAHSIGELKKMPGDGDLEGKSLLERYKAKADAEKQSARQDASVIGGVELKSKLCKHFIDGECKFKEGCHFAHGIEELKRLPEDGDDGRKALLERYKTKVGVASAMMNGESAQALTQTEIPASTLTVAKTKLCKHFISGNCKFKESCNFAHTIEELKSLPGEGDDAGRALLEQYRSKLEVEKPEQADTLVSDATDRAEVEKTSVDTLTMQKIESLSNTATQAKVDDKSVRLLKTKMCKHFLVGACKYNKNCTFAHSIEELKPPADANDVIVKTTPVAPMPSPANKTSNVTGSTGQQITQPVQSSQQADGKQNEGPTQNKDDKQGLIKTKPCRFFSDGTCRFGNACAFIHNDQMHGIASQSGALQGPGELKATYKTRLCNMWEKDKGCSFGSKCHFAHGQEEMRQRAGPSVPGTNNLMYGALELEALSQAQQFGLSSSLPYSYDITDTHWRPFRATDEEASHGLGGGLGVVNERMRDAGAAEALHLRGLLQNYGQLEQASSLASLSSLGGANIGMTSNIFGNWPTRLILGKWNALIIWTIDQIRSLSLFVPPPPPPPLSVSLNWSKITCFFLV